MRGKPRLPNGSWLTILIVLAAAGGTGYLVGELTNGDKVGAQTASPMCKFLAKKNPQKAAILCAPQALAGSVVEPAPTASPADVCGSWSDASIPGTAAAIIQAEFGEVRNCLKIGTTWVLTTLGGGSRAEGAIAMYRCSTPACLNGQTEHGARGWHVIHSPYGGGTVLTVDQPAHTLLLDAGGHQISLNVDTGVFSTGG